MEAILPLKGVAILADTDPIRHMRLVQTLAILFYERECVGKTLIRCGVSVSRMMMAKSSSQRPTERVSEVLGWTATQSAHSLAKRLKPVELRGIIEYILCVDYGVKRPSNLARLSEDGSRSFAYVAALLFEFLELCGKGKPSLNDLMGIQNACDTIHIWSQAARLNAADLTLILLNFHLYSNLVTPNSERIEDPIVPEDLSLAPASVIFISDHGKSSHHGLTTYSGCLERLVDALKYNSGHGFVPGARERLLRKLSVDFNDIIPSVVFDGQRQDAMARISTELARVYRISPLALDKAYPLPVPVPNDAPGILDNLTDEIAGVALSFLAGGAKQQRTKGDIKQESPVTGETSAQQDQQEVTTTQATCKVSNAAFERFTECVTLARGRWLLEESSSQRRKKEQELTAKLDKENFELQRQESHAKEKQEVEERTRWQLIYKEETEDDDPIELDPEEFMVEDPVQTQATALAIKARRARNKQKHDDGGEDDEEGEDLDEGEREDWELIPDGRQSACPDLQGKAKPPWDILWRHM